MDPTTNNKLKMIMKYSLTLMPKLSNDHARLYREDKVIATLQKHTSKNNPH